MSGSGAGAGYCWGFAATCEPITEFGLASALSIACICSWDNDATSAAIASGLMAPDEGGMAGVEEGMDIEGTGAGGVGVAAFSLSLLRIQIAIMQSAVRVFGSVMLSSTSMNSGMGSSARKGTIYSSLPG